MDQKVFINKELKAPSLFQKMTNSHPKENAIIELNNLFSELPVKEISLEKIEAISQKYKIDLIKKFKAEIENIYKTYLQHCFNDFSLSDDEVIALNHLKIIFHLSDLEIKKLNEEVGKTVYQKAFDEVLDDNQINDDERTFLTKLENELKLPSEIARNIQLISSSEILKKFIDNAISDQKLSPDEENELSHIAKNLNINLSFDDRTSEQLVKFKLFWQIENGNLPIIDCGINLVKGETCHFVKEVQWFEQRKATKRVNYGGPTLSIKIAKGLHYRAGSIGIQKISEDVWQLIDKGQIFLTNTRIIFMGNKGNKTIAINKVLDFTVYSNGIDIQKDSGKSPFIGFDNGTDLFAVLLGKIINT